MALTGIDIYLNRNEFSRYEKTRAVVKARIVPTPATGLVSESVVVSLEKKGVPLATRSISFSGDAAKGAVVEFDLADIVDSDGISHINRGEYRITATQAMLTASASFSASIITADEMRRTYCQGLHLVSGYKMMPKRQPSVVTGVVITNISKGTKKGVVGLSFDFSSKTLTWGKGTPIPVTEDSNNEILLDGSGNYVEVDVDYFALPSADAAEGILLDQEELNDGFLQSEIEKATREVEVALKVFMEPTRVATEPYFSNPEQGEYFDRPASPLTFYERDFNMRGMGWCLNIPHNQVGKVTDLCGYIGNTKAMELKSGALSVNRKSGMVNVLPFNSQYSMYWTFFIGINFWGTREYIADFWRYKAVAGIADDAEMVIKMIGYTAAISILTTAEQAWRSGMTSESFSKDGVSRTQAYNAKGVYDSAIQQYKEWNKTNIPVLSKLYRSIPMVVL